MADRVALQITRRKTRDRSAVLVMFGAILLLPPFAWTSLAALSVADVPFTLIYVFAVWVALIVGAALLASPLAQSDDADDTLENTDSSA